MVSDMRMFCDPVDFLSNNVRYISRDGESRRDR